jgi:chromosome segregation ATPase
MSFPGGSQEEVKFYEEQCRLQDEHVSKLKSEIESLKANSLQDRSIKAKQAQEISELKSGIESLKAKNRYQEILIEEFENKVKELIKEREELKAKLEESGNSIYEEWADAKIKDLTKENTELKSKLSAQDWHDASELPMEEGEYLLRWHSTNITEYCKSLFELRTKLHGWINGDDPIKYDDIFWRRIIPPEGK